MRVLSVVHQTDAAAGTFADEVAARGHALDEWLIPEDPEPPAPLESYDAVLVFGGAMHVDQEDRHGWLHDERLLLQGLAADEVPLMGVCLGGQLVAKALHAHVRRLPSPEIGWPEVELTEEAADDPVFAGLPGRFPSFQWHLYHFELPTGAVPLARNERCLQAFRAGKSTWAIQFHAEVTEQSVRDWLVSSAPEEDGPLDAEALLAETDEKIAAWNELGRELCGRFLAYAEASAESRGATTRATSPRS
ncbi:MAG TPA: type 1 glutamine amidotransferase [Gaiellaceae bacterium]|nr:type 1 glutamine amidotransferase [Gaiellaceae bacterium]